MRVLFVTPELPNQFHRIRALNLLRALKHEGHEVDLISLTHREPGEDDLAPLRTLCRRAEGVVQPLARSLASPARRSLVWAKAPLRPRQRQEEQHRPLLQA